MPKLVPKSKEALALSAVGSSFATLAKFRSGERETALALQDAMKFAKDLS